MVAATLCEYKYSGCGNTFFLIDNRKGEFLPQINLIQELCYRTVDGVILLETSPLSDFRMRIFNADGSEAEMCGNGVRCLMRFIRDLHPEIERCTLETLAGEVTLKITEQGIRVGMPPPLDFRLNQTLEQEIYHFVNTGVPHAVFFVNDIESSTLMVKAPAIRNHSVFAPKGANVNFVQLKNGALWLRTYERGVEGETLACGTGATAAALITAKILNLSSPIQVIPRSQDPLFVEFNSELNQVALIGPAKRVNLG